MMLTQETPVPVKTARQRINWAKLFWMLRQSPLTIVGGVIMIAMLLVMVTSPWIVPHDPNALDLTARLQAPSAQHWFGTDEVGRDLFSRVHGRQPAVDRRRAGGGGDCRRHWLAAGLFVRRTGWAR